MKRDIQDGYGDIGASAKIQLIIHEYSELVGSWKNRPY